MVPLLNCIVDTSLHHHNILHTARSSWNSALYSNSPSYPRTNLSIHWFFNSFFSTSLGPFFSFFIHLFSKYVTVLKKVRERKWKKPTKITNKTHHSSLVQLNLFSVSISTVLWYAHVHSRTAESQTRYS